MSLDVRQNEIVTIIGANGAGKTTLLNAIIGIQRLKGGLTFDARDLTRLEIEDRVATGLCLVPEHRELFGTMPVEDNLLLGGFRIKAAQSARDAGEGVRAVPAPEGAPPPAGRHAVRRRAADAGDGAGA